MTAGEAEEQLRGLADEQIAVGLRRFFKTGPGEYGEGDRFLGVKVPPLRQLARAFHALPLEESVKLLHSPFHEARLLALLYIRPVESVFAGPADDVVQIIAHFSLPYTGSMYTQR